MGGPPNRTSAESQLGLNLYIYLTLSLSLALLRGQPYLVSKVAE